MPVKGLLLSIALLFAYCAVANAQAPAAPSPAVGTRLTLEDLYSEYNVIDADISPSGKFIAASIRRKDDDAIVALDLTTGKKELITRINKDAFGKQIDVHIGFVYWKTEDRLLFQITSEPNDGLDYNRLSRGSMLKLGERLYGVDRNGKNLVHMFGGQYKDELIGAFDTSDIASMLWKDPKHILVRVGGWEGRSLFKVDVTTGEGKLVEKQRESVYDWWFDVDGNAVVRVEYSLGTLRYYRKMPDGKWKKYYSVRRKELNEQPEYDLIGPSTDPTRFYVLARPPGKDRIGIYLYDLPNESFGETLYENPVHDIALAVSLIDGTKLLYHCYDAHVRICDFADPGKNAYMRGLRKFFEESANVNIVDASEDDKIVLLRVEGPSDPPAFYYYLVDKKAIEFVGFQQGALRDRAMPTAAVITYKTRDGKEQTGYLTYPPGAKDAQGSAAGTAAAWRSAGARSARIRPLGAVPRGRGYAVFQPNFRGSGGFGEAFELSGHREWGRKMQDDLGDGVKTLADRGIIDPARVCIVGGSYGGYAALAGATLTPDAYKCAVSLAGVGDLEAMVRFEEEEVRRRLGCIRSLRAQTGRS